MNETRVIARGWTARPEPVVVVTKDGQTVVRVGCAETMWEALFPTEVQAMSFAKGLCS